MHPESEHPQVIDVISTTELASPVQKTRATMSLGSQGRLESDMNSPYDQDIASSPSFGSSEDSLPALNLSGSPSPMSRRVSIADSVPATPTSHLIEGARVDHDSDTSPRYHRIHSTPYPKPRIPLQLTPHPQARVVSLPEWTRNRDPFLEAMRNLRSVSSPARFKRPPLSPLSAEEDSFELSGSSQSAASAVSFPALAEQRTNGHSILSEHTSLLSVPREQFYTAPEGFFLTPPSFKSMKLSPMTTGPERSLPQDRLLPPIREDDSVCSVEPNSEDEVSHMLRRATLDTSGYYNHSSVSFSNTSRSSSPESVVFLSSIARISRSFLGGKSESQPISEASLTQESVGDTTAHDGGDGAQEHPPTETHAELSGRESPQQYTTATQGKPTTSTNKDEASASPIVSSPAVRHDPDWIFFDPPRPIPALHGPPSLPYARCPSGAEGVVLDDQQELDGVVWGLSEKDPRSRHPDEHRRVETSRAEQFVPVTKYVRPSRTATHENKRVESTMTSLVSEARPLAGAHNPRPLSTVAEHTSPSPNSKEKHVRFVDGANGGTLPSHEYRTPAPNTKLVSTSSVSEPNIPTDLTQVLLDQVEKARAIKPKPLQQAFPPASRIEILDQLRRFGVPFRPHGLPTPPSTASPKFVSQFPPSDPPLAPGRVIRHTNTRPLAAAHEPSVPKTFAQATMQDRTTTALFRPRDSDMPIRATGPAPGSLSNIKSIPLLKLRQRQHAGMESWRHDEQPFGEAALPMVTYGVWAGSARNVNEPSASAAKTLRPNSTPCQVDSISATTVMPEKTTAAGPSSGNNRRQRRAGKRAPQEAPTAQPDLPSKENHQAAGPKSNTDARKSSRQTGRKRNQRTRTDSLPQNAPRT
ncbi:unnamed protein product [Rhizoctonia solani]|uniref:Uncharacterized protein n=1 Tax=Rhizoctonia solani TaxID=456999 RepID=A0A8H3ABU5_9AGAM|nr:unnamed protein product [Rhizoctonia solani]